MAAELSAAASEQTRIATILEWLKPLTTDSNNRDVYLHQQPFEPIPRPLPDPQPPGGQDALLVLLPLLIVLSTFLFLLLIFLICILLLRRRRGILLRDNDGPVDLGREELIDGDGGFEGIESRWLENVDEETRRSYLRAKETLFALDYQVQCPPNSLPTDITLSQFLAIQEKGVSAWSFEPDYEFSPSVLVHSRTELTFLPDPSSASSVQSNLPLPKLNEVYYWEVKMFDLPSTTHASVGLATKPYPSFRLPGHSRYSVAYHSSGDKSYNYPFTQATFGSVLKEGDVLGVGYRPRTGTVFFTRNGRKLEDAFVGLTRWNLFPTIGADGPCSLHVNLGQSGFVFIEANVKKWGLAPSVGTLAPPPAYGAERGSILLEAGEGRIPTSPPPPLESPSTSAPNSLRRSHRSRRVRQSNNNLNQPVNPSPLRGPPLTPSSDNNEPNDGAVLSPSESAGTPVQQSASDPPSASSTDSAESSRSPSRQVSTSTAPSRVPELRISPTTFTDDDIDSSELTPNPPTPGNTDIHLRPILGRNTPSANTSNVEDGHRHDASVSSRSRRRNDDRRRSSNGDVGESPSSRPGLTLSIDNRPPPAYSPLDAFHYPEGVHVDLPAEIISAAIEGINPSPNSATTSPSSQRQMGGSRRARRS
ncbi:hypothetical protein Clacol_008065 [Clathrus columnatus]|uniref:B30.2/SPRY domain-containing protein n=1 Tax=Clathrus columnatus TaxID=1419009 RepID=A0AAV5AL42_9AGAM|nr:hypothetical protein Clacol_008065 [Clathrus columnatus]